MMKVIRECGRARNAQGWRKLGPRGLCGNSNLGQPPYIYIYGCYILFLKHQLKLTKHVDSPFLYRREPFPSSWDIWRWVASG